MRPNWIELKFASGGVVLPLSYGVAAFKHTSELKLEADLRTTKQ